MCGISRSRFAKVFGVEIEAVYGDVIQKMMTQGLLKQQAGKYFSDGRGDFSQQLCDE